MNRRHFLATAASTLTSSLACAAPPVQRSGVSLNQEPLSYGFDALEPHLDAATMEWHYADCHAAYVSDLRQALGSVNVEAATVSSLLRTMDHLTPKGQRAVLQLGRRVEMV